MMNTKLYSITVTIFDNRLENLAPVALTLTYVVKIMTLTTAIIHYYLLKSY